MTIAGDVQESGLDRRVADLRKELLLQNKADLARKTGAAYRDGGFLLDVWNRNVAINDNDFVAIDLQSGDTCDPLTQAMLAYYFTTSDGAPVVDEWIAFSELPDGQFYTAAFQGYTGNNLAKRFGNDIAAFDQAAVSLGGLHQPIGDAAYRFQMLPRVPAAVVCWLGDEDFPTSYRILFDRSINHHLPTDACAILGSMLTSGLSKAIVQRADS